ncbi:MAG: hypothetical protein M3Y91_02845 [Actinomycetota bacterium]|nr:hypothetical protein [Actinomycetota bacterium]
MSCECHELSAAESVFVSAVATLRKTYRDHTFYVERDVVHYLQILIRNDLPDGFRVFNDYGIVRGPRRARSADIAILVADRVLVAAEFKFEPCARRADIMANKLPVIGWVDELKDIARIEEFVNLGVAAVGFSICIDEGGRYRAKDRPTHSRVEDWDTGYGTQVTVTRWPPVTPRAPQEA